MSYKKTQKFYIKWIVSIVLLTVMSFANSISMETAETVAQNFLTKEFGKPKQSLSEQSFVNDEDNPTYYIINMQEGGWVFVSADDVASPIIGFNDTGSIKKDNKLNPAFKAWMSNVSKTITKAKKKVTTSNNKNSSTSSNKITQEIKKLWEALKDDDYLQLNQVSKSSTLMTSNGPLLTTTWNQNNTKYTPHLYPIGCVATAMGQIMKYHNWPDRGVGSHTDKYYKEQNLFANFGATTYHWKDMSNNGSGDAVAKLLYHVGISVDMDYTSDGSSAYSGRVPNALRTYFKYSASNLIGAPKNYSLTWEKKIKQSIDAHRPVYYRGTKLGVAAHAFVCDGYRKNHFFHFNMGWGSSGSYFLLYGLTPGKVLYFTDQHGGIFNIVPLRNIKAPSNLTVNNITAHSATLTWEDNSNDETGFEVLLGNDIITTLNANAHSYSLKGLREYTVYRYRVRAINSKGVSPEIHISFNTKNIVPVSKSLITSPAPNTAVKLGSKLNITWKNYGTKTVNLVVMTMDVDKNYYNRTIYNTNNGRTKKTSQLVTIPTSSKGILIYLRTYDDITGKEVGYVRHSVGIIKSVVEAPSNLKAKNVQKTTATLTWKDNSSNEQGFKIYKGSRYEGKVGANRTSYPLKNLKPNTNYSYSVKAYNSVGKLSKPARTSFKTKPNIKESKSIITSPQNGTKVQAGENVTIRWKNHGATRIEFYAIAKVNGIYKKIKYDTNIKGSNTRIKIPLGFIQAYIYIKSYRANNKPLGISIIYLYPKKGH